MRDYMWAAVAVVGAVVSSRCWYRAKLRVLFPGVSNSVARLLDRSQSARLLAACGLERPGPVSCRSLLSGDDDRVPRVLGARPSPAGADVTLHPAVGQAPDAVAAAADRIGAALGVPIVAGTLPAGSVVWSLRVRDPLASEILAPLHPNGGGTTLNLGVMEAGDPLMLPLANTSGVVVAGVPGAGKTGAMTRWVAELCASTSMALFVIDGKASADWLAFADRATLLVNDGRFASALASLEAMADVMDYRLTHAPQLFGGVANFWDAPAAIRPPLVMAVIDECQVLFSAQADKDAKAMSARCIQLVGDLVRRGRSAGVGVICATQRPTVDAIPGTIRDNSSARISFRVMTADSARAVLGNEFGVAGTVSPIGAPTGVGVVLAESLAPTRFRVQYATPPEVSEFLEAYGGDRIPLDELAPGLSYDLPVSNSDEKPPL
jgi:hypothetical protein